MEREVWKIFEEFEENDYLEFDKVENKRSNRRDLHAFLLLDELFPLPVKGKDKDGNPIVRHDDMISAAEHDEFYLDIDYDNIQKLTDDQILELVRCGVRMDDDSLCMFA